MGRIGTGAGEPGRDEGKGGLGERLPALGPRGEGWVAIQAVLLAGIGLSILAGPAVSGPARLAAAAVGVLLLAAGGALGLAGLVGLGRSLTAFPAPRPDGELVTGGAYRLVRHPIYGGLVLGGLGWSSLGASPAALLLSAALLGFFDLKARREEAWLVEAYAGYAAYRRRTRRLIPWLY
ncbi:MAG TPA: methyltransferase [Candidatus Limnocylindrales bacterium]